MKKKLALLLVLVLALLCSAASAVVQPGDDFYYLDTADVLSTEAEGTIYFCNQLLEEACGGQIVVAALESIGGEDTFDYAYEMLNDWGVGSSEDGNGIVLLMAIREDDYAVAVGSGVEGIFSAGVLNDYFDKYLEPEFAKKNYEAGALKLFEALLDKYIDRYNLNFSFEDGERMAASQLSQYAEGGSFGGAHGGGGYGGEYGETYYENDAGISGFAIVVIVIVLIIIFSGANNRRRGRPFFGPVVFFSGPRHHHPPHHHVHHHAPRHTPPRSGFTSRPSRPGGASRMGGFGSSGRTGGFSGSFGGARGGGGRSFGGGARRGRH